MRCLLPSAILLIIAAAAVAGCAGSDTTREPGPVFELATIDPLTTDHASTGGISWVDYDGDGDLDQFVTNGYDVSSAEPVGQPNRLYRNDGAAGFTAITAGTLAATAGYSSGHTWGDYDNDGDLDVFITNQQEQDNLLFRNDGDGAFTRVDGEPQTLDGGHSYAAAWVDVDNDGLLDLFVANGGMSHAGANGLYRGTGDGHFTKITAGDIVTLEAATCGIAWGDYDNDGDLDLFLANQGFAAPGNNNELYRNEGEWKFTRITASVVAADGAPSCAATWVDIDNDLDLDLHVTNMYGMADFLYRNDGRGGFIPVNGSPLTLDGGHTYGANWEDYDNDGDIDAIVTNWGAGTGLYLSDGRGNFARAAGGDLGTRIEYVGAVASGDCDGDGDTDIIIGNWPNNPGPGEPNPLFLNRGNPNHWLGVRLIGHDGSRGGIGARVLVTADAGVQMRQVTSQTGFRGQSDLDPHFGLGEATGVDRLEVRWPSGRVSVLEDVAPDQVIVVAEPGGGP